MFLLDTNVVSERSKLVPDERVRGWLQRHRIGETYLSVITLAELEQGILRLGNTRRATELRSFLERLEGQFHGRVLDIDRQVASTWAQMTAQAIQAGQTLGYADSLIAATARTHHLTVVTRNTADFLPAGVPVINPWQTDEA
ncbi:type II toxin-antitoxin system VapC family toxin [Deinococcus ruber]|uniref:Ribonuclease VapC n=1 Tax=Deinococcus ruber TaxID=1848197 RepID=A0A918CE16_9DEIO|nr:type II toxin-antitoxin system VapC family toxin [Deinococcus ruber]GGR18285.1 toxin FitB [Deinococcus ruber]